MKKRKQNSLYKTTIRRTVLEKLLAEDFNSNDFDKYAHSAEFQSEYDLSSQWKEKNMIDISFENHQTIVNNLAKCSKESLYILLHTANYNKDLQLTNLGISMGGFAIALLAIFSSIYTKAEYPLFIAICLILYLSLIYLSLRASGVEPYKFLHIISTEALEKKQLKEENLAQKNLIKQIQNENELFLSKLQQNKKKNFIQKLFS